MSKYSENIKKYRLEKNLTQEQLAKQLFVTKQAISKWETGRGYPDTQTLPAIAKILEVSIDELMGESMIKPKVNYRKVIYFSVFSTSIIFIILLSTLAYIRNQYDITQSISDIEERVEIELPHYGEYVSENFSDWILYGNSVSVSKMSYMVFSRNTEIATFEKSIQDSTIWTSSFDETLLVLVPSGIQAYLTIGDHYLIYNESLSKYNEIPVSTGLFDYVLMIYQEDIHRLIIFEYALVYGGETNEN
ncbi:MAG: helix-turn-helix domain-containing protein [Firmicutes bacterium]|nr:helix-turn-helix domain-containing protein [Bacillota bacterium]